MDSRRWFHVIPWFGIPMLFALFGKLTYWLVEARIIQSFFPGEIYWIVAIVLHVILGLVVYLRVSGLSRKLLMLGYVFVMAAVLLAIQGTVSCLSGDCF
jgi:hypothetical protein